MTDSPVSTKRWIKPVAVVTIAIFIVALLGYSYASPYIALNRLKQAADARDAATLNQYVDYPALRISLKQQVGNMLEKRIEAQHSSNPLLLFGAVIGAALIGPLVDAYATPDGVAALLDGMPPRGEPGEKPPTAGAYPPGANPPGAVPPNQDSPATAQREPAPSAEPGVAGSGEQPKSTAGYRGINEFVVTWQPSTDEPRYAAILQRHGLFSWKLAAVELNG